MGALSSVFSRMVYEGYRGQGSQPFNSPVLLMSNEIGVSVIGMCVATFLIAKKTEKHFPVVLINMIVGFGSLFVTLYHILIRKASSEWSHVFTVLIMMGILVVLYPWKVVFRKKTN